MEQVQRLFASTPVLDALRRALPKGRFEARRRVLYLEEPGTITDVERLIDLHKLFEVTLHRLEEINAAPDPPGPPEDDSS